MSIFTDCKTGFDALVTYFQAVSDYLTTGITPPDPTPIDAALVSSGLIEYAVNNATYSGAFSVGSSIEAASEFNAIQREKDMGQQSKLALISSAAADMQDEVAYYGQTGGYHIGVLGGAPTSGAQA